MILQSMLICSLCGFCVPNYKLLTTIIVLKFFVFNVIIEAIAYCLYLRFFSFKQIY